MSRQHNHVIFAECFEEMTDEEILDSVVNCDGPLTAWHEAVLQEQADRGLVQPIISTSKAA